jgi:hypothetical protein
MWGSLGWAAAAWIVGKYIDSNPNLAFWLASLAIVIAAICFMLTKIELTEAECKKQRAEGLPCPGAGEERAVLDAADLYPFRHANL